MRFAFSTVDKIIFGEGSLAEIGGLAAPLSTRAFVVTGKRALRSSGTLARLEDALAEEGIEFTLFSVDGEPDVNTVDAGVALATDMDPGCDLVIGIGGGSAMDTAKAIAALLTNGGSVLDYMEVVGRGQPLVKPSLPLIAIPTTAGTGSEVTRNAVIRDPDSGVKASLRSDFLFPKIALVDPELTYSLPPPVTASTGLDALTQLIEAYTSASAQPLTDALACEGIKLAARSLMRAYEHGDDKAAREDMSLASLLSGLALANAGLGAVHGFAATLGGRFGISHGVACACMLPEVLEANIRHLQSKRPTSPVLRKYVEIMELLTASHYDSANAAIDAGIQFVHELCRRLKVPTLAELGVGDEDIEEIAASAARASSMKANPVTFSQAELEGILRSALAPAEVAEPAVSSE